MTFIHILIKTNRVYILRQHMMHGTLLYVTSLRPAVSKADDRDTPATSTPTDRSLSVPSSSSQWPRAVCGAIRGGGGGSIYRSLFYSNISRTHAAVRYQSEATIYQMTPFHCKLKFTGDDDRFVAVPETSVQLNLARRKNAYSFCWCRTSVEFFNESLVTFFAGASW